MPEHDPHATAGSPNAQDTCAYQPAEPPGPSTPPPLPHVAGYEVLEVLGRSGMGVVYKARHLALQRTVALKMVLAGELAAEGEVARFRAEGAAIARLQHPGIVQVFEVGQAGGRPFCALEFVEGGNLARRLAGTPQPPREAAGLVAALAAAMQYAHSRGVVHRDLKPANVLLAPDGTPKVTDFALAKLLDDAAGHTQQSKSGWAPFQPEKGACSHLSAGRAASRPRQVVLLFLRELPVHEVQRQRRRPVGVLPALRRLLAAGHGLWTELLAHRS
jgi:serine/threonine-protein kinase